MSTQTATHNNRITIGKAEQATSYREDGKSWAIYRDGDICGEITSQLDRDGIYGVVGGWKVTEYTVEIDDQPVAVFACDEYPAARAAFTAATRYAKAEAVAD